MSKKRLYIFNLETNLENPVLAFTHDWISSFASQVDQIVVYSTHVGSHNLPQNVEVFEIGGGSLYLRIQAVIKLIKSSISIFKFRKDSIVFHHMSTKTLILPGFFIRAMRVRQGFWYSHSAKPISLRIATRIADVIFSSTREAFPIKTSKIVYVGHGLNLSKSEEIFEKLTNSRKGIVSLGRITAIKNLDKLLISISKLSKIPEVTFIGPSHINKILDHRLMLLAEENNVILRILPPINHTEVLNKLNEFSMYYTGTPQSVDKSTIEAASVGCFIITMEKAAQELTGMELVWDELDQSPSLSISEQIKVLEKLNEVESRYLRNIIHRQTIKKNEVVNTTQKILDKLKK